MEIRKRTTETPVSKHTNQSKEEKSKCTWGRYLVLVLVFVCGYFVMKNQVSFSQNSITSTSTIASGGLNLEFDAGTPEMLSKVSALTFSRSHSFVSKRMGFQVGGAMDSNNFRENIDKGFLPLPSDITFEGVFKDYYFDSGSNDKGIICTQLFCPTYSVGVSRNPFDAQTIDYYLSVGLTSGHDENAFVRPHYDAVIVLDISGSMSSPFNSYYYGNSKADSNDIDPSMSKLKAAKIALVSLLSQLRQEDRAGLVLFDTESIIAFEPSYITQERKEEMIRYIEGIEARGGTDIHRGLITGFRLLQELVSRESSDQIERRIILLTDAMPNTGAIEEADFKSLLQEYSENARPIHTTVVGVGIDFNTELTEAIMKVKGANYFSVHEPSIFVKRVGNEFEYMMTPMAFDVSLQIQPHSVFEIEKAYGAPSYNPKTGEFIHISTLFPSATTQDGVKGGVILVKLRKKDDSNITDFSDLVLRASYSDRSGKKHVNQKAVHIEKFSNEIYESSAVRKAVLLSRLGSLLQHWLVDENTKRDNGETLLKLGRPLPSHFQLENNNYTWERKSNPLRVSSGYKGLFKEFIEHLDREIEALGDKNIEQERKLLMKLMEWKLE